MKLRVNKNRFIFVLMIFLFCGNLILPKEYYNIIDYGAMGDGKTINTLSIQSAIDDAAENGGGIIFFPAGDFLTRTIILKDNITLYLSNGCKILGTTDLNRFDSSFGSFVDSDGRKFGTALIFAKDANNISIEGNGIIDGQGYEIYYPRKEGIYRPYIIRFIRCNFVKIKDVTLLNSAAWVQHYIECDDLLIDGITVRSYSNKNNDGLNIEGCQRVTVTRCNIDSEDDSIVLKTLSTRACKDIVISDCIISGLKSAIKTGTESAGNFENITITNCVIYGTRGISLLAVDGGSINNVTISNISMRDTYAVIVIRLGNRMRKYAIPDSLVPDSHGTIKNVMISNIQAVNVTECNDFICGIPNGYVENINLSNIKIEYLGGGKYHNFINDIPELEDEYPKAKMFGTMPAYGFFIRHAKNITIKDLEITYNDVEERPALYLDDVIDFKISGLKAKVPTMDTPLIYLRNSQEGIISGSIPVGSLKILAKIDGSDTKKIIFNENYLDDNSKRFIINPEVSANQVYNLK